MTYHIISATCYRDNHVLKLLYEIRV